MHDKRKKMYMRINFISHSGRKKKKDLIPNKNYKETCYFAIFTFCWILPVSMFVLWIPPGQTALLNLKIIKTRNLPKTTRVKSQPSLENIASEAGFHSLSTKKATESQQARVKCREHDVWYHSVHGKIPHQTLETTCPTASPSCVLFPVSTKEAKKDYFAIFSFTLGQACVRYLTKVHRKT